MPIAARMWICVWLFLPEAHGEWQLLGTHGQEALVIFHPARSKRHGDCCAQDGLPELTQAVWLSRLPAGDGS